MSTETALQSVNSPLAPLPPDNRQPPPPPAESPSLRVWVPGGPQAYEMKFLLDAALARDVESRLRPGLMLDPHADPALDHAYRTTTLYCDTPDRDVFRGLGRHQRRKYRVRRYGIEPRVYLERKHKQGERVRKRRTPIADGELRLLVEPVSAADWAGNWFREQFARRDLRPVCRVQYLRTAYFGTGADSALRVTFDRDVRGLPTDDWCVAPFSDGTAALSGQVICEFKFSEVLPTVLRSVIQELRIVPRGVSKYRHCMAATGLMNWESIRHA